MISNFFYHLLSNWSALYLEFSGLVFTISTIYKCHLFIARVTSPLNAMKHFILNIYLHTSIDARFTQSSHNKLNWRFTVLCRLNLTDRLTLQWLKSILIMPPVNSALFFHFEVVYHLVYYISTYYFSARLYCV